MLCPIRRDVDTISLRGFTRAMWAGAQRTQAACTREIPPALVSALWLQRPLEPLEPERTTRGLALSPRAQRKPTRGRLA